MESAFLQKVISLGTQSVLGKQCDSNVVFYYLKSINIFLKHKA